MPALELSQADAVKVAALVATFHRGIQRDKAVLGAVVRALKRGGPDAEMLCRLINHRPLHAGNSTDARDEEISP